MSDAPDASLRRFAGYTMKRAFNAVQADVNATLAPFGLRMVTFSALVVIVDNPGLKQSELARVLMIERPNLVVILDELERADWITRDRSTTDRRAYQLRCTLAGSQVCLAAQGAVEAHDRRMTEGLDPGALTAFHAGLRRVEANGVARKGDKDEHSHLSGS